VIAPGLELAPDHQANEPCADKGQQRPRPPGCLQPPVIDRERGYGRDEQHAHASHAQPDSERPLPVDSGTVAADENREKIAFERGIHQRQHDGKRNDRCQHRAREPAPGEQGQAHGGQHHDRADRHMLALMPRTQPADCTECSYPQGGDGVDDRSRDQGPPAFLSGTWPPASKLQAPLPHARHLIPEGPVRMTRVL